MTVLVSSTYDDNYFFFLPIISWAWHKLDANVFFILPCDYIDADKHSLVMRNTIGDEGVYYFYADAEKENALYAQCSRLYAGCLSLDEDEIALTSDIDMLPLSDYWHPDKNVFTSYGRDLTDFHNPICYLAATVKKWREVMNIEEGDIEKYLQIDLGNEPFYKSLNKEEYWVTDQQIITKRLLNRNDVIRVDRGVAPNSHYPLGRIDRGAWDKTIQQPLRIDAHLLRPGYTEENWSKILPLIRECFNPSQEEIEWLNNYRNEYIKLI